jgi:hypothetical protein
MWMSSTCTTYIHTWSLRTIRRSTGPSRLLTGRRTFHLGPECETNNRIFPDATFLQGNEKADYRKPDFPMGSQPISSAGRVGMSAT